MHPRFNISWLSYCRDSEEHLPREASNMCQKMYKVNQVLQLDKRQNIKNCWAPVVFLHIYTRKRNLWTNEKYIASEKSNWTSHSVQTWWKFSMYVHPKGLKSLEINVFVNECYSPSVVIGGYLSNPSRISPRTRLMVKSTWLQEEPISVSVCTSCCLPDSAVC